MYKFCKNAAKTWYAGYSPNGKFWLTLGLGALIVDAAISYQYGITLTALHGAGFALVAIFFALLPDAAYSEIEAKRPASGIALALLCVPLGAVAFYSHLGYGAGVRLGDMQQAGVQNTKHEDKREVLGDKRKELANMEKLRSELIEANGWTATTTADALRAQVAVAQKDIDLEAARKGCKQKCRDRMKEKADLESRIAVMEKSLDLTTRIEAATRKIEQLTKEASASEYVSSSVVNQNNVAAQLWLAFTGATPENAVNPDAVTSSFTSIVIAGGGSLAFMIMAPVGFFVAGRNRVPAGSYSYQAPIARHETDTGHNGTAPGQHTHTVERIVIDDRNAVDAMKRMIADALRNPRTA